MAKFESRSSGASKKLYERSEFNVVLILLLLFLKFTIIFAKNCPPRIERKRDSIEFERSENQGQFFKRRLLIIFNVFKYF